jgi:hypothetical protein
MWILFINLLIRYTKCIVIVNDRKLLLEWIFKKSSFTLTVIAPEGMRIIRVDKNTIRIVPYCLKKQTHWCPLKRWLRAYLKKYATGLPWIQNML